MSDELLSFFKETYENDSACVLILDNQFSLLWQNGRPAPFDKNEDLRAILNIPDEGILQSGDYSFCLEGILYEYHLTNVSGKYFIISCSCTPALMRLIGSRHGKEAVENVLSSRFVSTHGIAAAAAALNDKFEESGSMESSEDDFYQQLNIIMRHCSHILREQYIFREMLIYQNEPDDSELLDCAVLLEDFKKQCRDVLSTKNGAQIICHADPDMTVYLSKERFCFLMMCLLVELCKDSEDIFQISISGSSCNGFVSVILSATPVGEAPDFPRLISEFAPIHEDSPAFATERMVIDAFCRRYSCTPLETTLNGTKAYCLRIPESDISQGMELKSHTSKKENPIITPYHAMLSDISDFRYY